MIISMNYLHDLVQF